MPHTYEKDGAAIYAESFATIRNEADLARFSEIEEVVVVRMIHAAGMVDLAPFVQFTPNFAVSAQQAAILAERVVFPEPLLPIKASIRVS